MVAKNVAIIGVGSAALIWWERRKNAVPRQVRDLAYEAAELQREGQAQIRKQRETERLVNSAPYAPPTAASIPPLSSATERSMGNNNNNSNLARRKWKEALAISTANSLSPKVLFNLTFALACNLDESGETVLAEQEFKNALASFPENFDLHTLEENTRARVGITLDRLAQMEQDRGKYAEAMLLYDRALDAMATPEEVATLANSLLERPVIVEAIAGVLNNVSTLYVQLGREPAARKVLERSEALMNSRKMSSVNIEPQAGEIEGRLE